MTTDPHDEMMPEDYEREAFERREALEPLTDLMRAVLALLLGGLLSVIVLILLALTA